MRRGTWIFAILGAMVLQHNGFAADPDTDLPLRRDSLGTSRTSSTKPAKRSVSTADARIKNYYDDLFIDETMASPPNGKRTVSASDAANPGAQEWEDDSLVNPPKKTSAKGSPKSGKFEPSTNDLPSNAGKKTAMKTEPTVSSGKVSQADLKVPQGKKNPIQQVRSDARPRSAPPIDGAEVPFSSQARKTQTRETPISKQVAGESISRHTDVPPTSAGVVVTPQNVAQTPQVTVEWLKRGEFNVGQECFVDLVVKNSGAVPVTQVAVDAFFPTNVRLVAAEPQPESATDRLTWTFDQLTPGVEHKMTVKLIPSRRGEIGATAQVRFTGAGAGLFAVNEPMLKVSLKSPPKEILLGDPASQVITVTNPGTGTAQDVKIEAKLSDGLEHPSREDHLIIEVGSVGPDETRTYRLGLTAAKGGLQSVNVIARSSMDVTSSASVEFNVVAPSLRIAVDGPSLRYRGRNAKYNLTITNDGSLVNNNIHISQIIPDGFKFVSADHQGKFEQSTRMISWFVGRLEPGDSTQVSCELNSLLLGEYTHTVQVVSDSGVQAEAKIDTRIDGIASLTMELVDFDDPVETGSETAYEIRVKNDGSKAATGVVVTCELPAGMELLSTKSPVERIAEGRQLIFQPIDEIAPGGQVTIRIQMKVLRDGSHRMKARLTGGGLQEPMVLEEVTRAYSDGSN